MISLKEFNEFSLQNESLQRIKGGEDPLVSGGGCRLIKTVTHEAYGTTYRLDHYEQWDSDYDGVACDPYYCWSVGAI